MPYAVNRRGLRIPRAYDRRVRLTTKDRANIRRLHGRGWAIRKIARKFKGRCSRSLIGFVIYPERLERAKELHRIRRVDGRYYKREKHRAAMKKHRRYKHSIRHILEQAP